MRILLALAMILIVAGTAAQAATADGTIVAMKGGDRSSSDNVSGATNYATGVSGAVFEYTTGNPTVPATPWTAFSSATNASGQASATVPAGTYYVREKSPGSGFGNFGPVNSLSYAGSHPYVARVVVQNNQTSYAFPHTNTDANPVNWSPANAGSASNNGSPFINVRDNGVQPKGCGTNILLVLDRSGSIEPYKDQYEAAAKQFVSSLNGTPTQIGIISFNSSVNSYSPAQGNASYYQSPLSLANAGSAATLNAVISNVYASPENLTNWDGVLQAASQAKSFTADAGTGQTVNPDLVAFITDGNPTTSEVNTSSSNEDLINLTSGMASANLVKNQAARPGGKVKLLAIGVGTGVTIDNLKAVSGPDEGVDGDYAAPTIPELTAFLSELAASQCGARVYVRKLVDGKTGNQPNWFYTATDPRPGMTPTYLDGNRATHPSGNPPVVETGAFFSRLPASPTTVNVNEDANGQPITNFDLVSVDCRRDGYDGAPVSGGVKNGLQFSLPVNRGDAIYCTYTNSPKTSLSVAKTPDNQFINAGDDVEFTIQVSNTGANSANSVSLNDPLPAAGVGGWTITQQPGGNPCGIAGGTLSCSFGTVNPGQTVAVKVKTGTSFAVCGTFDNQAAQASASNAPSVSDSGKVTCRKPNLSIVKTGNGTITAGQDATFTVSVANSGPGTARAVSLTDPLPGGTAGAWSISSQSPGGSCSTAGANLSCNFGDLAAGQQGQVTVKAPTNTTACAVYNNLATAASANHPSIQDSDTVTCNKPTLGTLKTAVQGTISAGDKAQFEIAVTNTGPGTATAVKLADPLPGGVSGPWIIATQPAGAPCQITAGVLNCDFGDLPAGSSKTVRVEATTDFDHCAELKNLATASATNAPNSSDDATIHCDKPNLTVTKQGNGLVNAGEKVSFSITVANAGPGISRSVMLNDPLPAGAVGGWAIGAQPSGDHCSISAGKLSCDFGDLAAGESKVVTVEAMTDQTNCTTYDNTVTATSSNSPDAVGQDSVTCRKPSLTVEKSGNGPVNAGENVTFSVSVANSGPGIAKAVTLNDSLPGGTAAAWTISGQPAGDPCEISGSQLNCSFGDLAAGASATVIVTAPTSANDCGRYDNTALASASNAPEQSSSASVECRKPSLTLNKTGNGTVNAGDDITFTLNLQNGGPGTAKSVTTSDPLPTWTARTWSITSQPAGVPCAIVAEVLNCDFGDLAPGASRSVTVSAATNFEHCTTYDNAATAEADNHAQVMAEARVNCQKPDLKIVKTGNGTVNAGEDVEFSIRVSNDGPGAAKAVAVNDALPTGMAGTWEISSQPEGEPCSITADVLNCSFGETAAGSTAEVKVKAPTSHDACKLFENSATVAGQGLPSVESRASVLCRKPNLGTLKTALEATISAGDKARFEIKVSNTGEGIAKAVTLTDDLPNGSWSIVNQPDGSPCSISDGQLSCDFGDLASGESRTVLVESPTDFQSCTQLVNEATASASNAPDASDSATVTCQKPALVIAKRGNGPIGAGQKVRFTIDVTNNGPGKAAGVTVEDQLPNNTAGPWELESSPEGAVCGIVDRVLRCELGDMESGKSVSIQMAAPTSDEKCSSYRNLATATAGNAPEVTDSATVECRKPRLQLRKQANRKKVFPGGTVRYRILVRNIQKESVATNLRVCDRLPGQMTVAGRGKGSFFDNGQLCWRIERLAYSRKWKVFTYRARVNDDVDAGTRLRNVVTLGNLRATRTVVVREPAVSPARRVTPVTG